MCRSFKSSDSEKFHSNMQMESSVDIKHLHPAVKVTPKIIDDFTAPQDINQFCFIFSIVVQYTQHKSLLT